MYYATYKNIGKTDIAIFKTKKERDDWVNYQDEFSIITGCNSTNSTFDRIPIGFEDIKNKIIHMKKKKDEFNSNQEWYIN